ncbi:UPF0481 protein At3g47200-like [Bidens hawaiensis]|uniref:UPF0481 protein At3g47200-like n=1 Tax=Bidens hawaiensis TaxID=980011 RepID=UPI0040494B83
MSVEDIIINPEIEVNYGDYVDSIINANPSASTANANPSQPAPIPKVVGLVKKTDDYEEYYVPKAVSIGPYHFGKPNLKPLQNLKPEFTNKLLKGNKETATSLYNKLGEMVQDLRKFYEEDSTTGFSDMEFTNMMVLDGCFIVYCITTIYVVGLEHWGELKNYEFALVFHDLFLLENQIPFKVLWEVSRLVKIDKRLFISIIQAFSYYRILAYRRPERFKWLKSILHILNAQSQREELNCLHESLETFISNSPDHLLHVLHHRLRWSIKSELPTEEYVVANYASCNFRKASELVDIGIHFKPSDTMSFARIGFFKGCWGFSANVELLPITVNDSTKLLLLNLMTYETSRYSIADSWVTSYVSLLDSLIDDAEDVKVLRRAWVLENMQGSDEKVAECFNEIGTGLPVSGLEYMEVKNKIQKHYESWRNTLFSQLKNEYFKSPWAIFVLLGALLALFLSVVQTYFSVWSPKSDCDDLCVFLKKNHHL